MALLFRLQEFGTTFATRARGAELRALAVSRSADDPGLIIDFADVTNVSYSFADEFVARLTADRSQDLKIELINMIDRVDRTVVGAQRRRVGETVC